MLALLLPRFIDSNAFTQFSDNAHSHPDQEISMSLKLRNPHQELQILSVPTRDNSEHITGRIWVINDTTRETEADRLKSEFASLVSHELKTPLTSIMGYSDILLNRDLPSEAQKNLLRILRSEAENLQSLVHEMLDYARIEANTVRINRWPIAVGELAVDLAKKLQHSVAFANHQIAFDVPPHLPPAYADKDRVRQILTNLISNAAKYSPDGGTITVRVRELANPPARHPDGQFLHISISDEGIGITAENLSRIWDRFVRVDTSNTKSIGGTGLGLTIVKGLVELHGGRAWAHSEINKGSTFHFSLPVATDLAHED
jgi:signal transduction histidine kinase